MLIADRKKRWTPQAIYNLRDRLGEKQAEFAAHFLLTAEAVSKWENGSPPSGPACVILEALERRVAGEPALLVDAPELQPA